MDSGVTETAYFPAGGGGYEQGHYKCLHASCAHRSDADYDAALGYAEAGFDVLPPPPQIITPEGIVEEPEGGATVLDPNDLRTVALSALRHRWRSDEGHETLLRSAGCWYEHEGARWRERSEEEVRSDLWRFLGTVYKMDKKGNRVAFNPGRDYISNVADALRSVCEQRGAQPPCWLPGFDGPEPGEMVSLSDGVLHVPSRALLPHSPGLFVLNTLPYAWGAGEQEPTEWLRFLAGLWPDDAAARETLQEIMGYLLTPDTAQQKMFMICGPRRSGKGTIGRILTALLGHHNIAAPTMQSLTTQFGLEPLIGKLVAMLPDARVSPGANGQAIVEKLLMLSGEDSVTIDRKNKLAWTGRPSARVLVLTNEPPRLGDASGALPGRFIVLSLYNSFFGREDHGLTSRLLKELPAIFRWALDGRDRLARRGYFVQPDSGLEDAEDMEAMGAPVALFVEEYCDLDAEAAEPLDNLFDAWRAWCASAGLNPGARESFGRALRVSFRGLHKERSRDIGRRAKYNGITLKEETRKNLLIGAA
jgi:putative DNA primase/helicase